MRKLKQEKDDEEKEDEEKKEKFDWDLLLKNELMFSNTAIDIRNYDTDESDSFSFDELDESYFNKFLFNSIHIFYVNRKKVSFKNVN